MGHRNLGRRGLALQSLGIEAATVALGSLLQDVLSSRAGMVASVT